MTESFVAADDLLRRLAMMRTPAERLRMCARMFSAAKTLVLAGMTSDLGEMTPVETQRQLFLRFYGKEFTDVETEAILEAINGSHGARQRFA